MAIYSVVEAKNDLSKLIDKALQGEAVTITRHGKPVVTINPIPLAVDPPPPKGDRAAMLEWMRVQREKLALQTTRSVDLIRAERDEDWR